MDLCGDKIMGTAVNGRMTKERTISALKDTIRHTKETESYILHSDRGRPYCAPDCSKIAKEQGGYRQHEPERKLPRQRACGELPEKN